MPVPPDNDPRVFTQQLAADGEPCPTCAMPLAADQRYCLACGERRAAPRIDFLALLAPAEQPFAAAEFDVDPAMDDEPVAVAGGMPGPRSLAFTGLSLLLAGAILGAALGPPATDSLAAGRGGLIVVQATPPPVVEAAFNGDAGSAEDFEDSGFEDAPAADTDAAPAEEAVAEEAFEEPTPEETDGAEETEAAKSVGHVVVLMLPGRPGAAFGAAAPAGYLRDVLPKLGARLTGYHAIGHGGLVNRIALISGQAPNAQTQAGCPTFSEFTPATAAPDGQFAGQGCVFPAAIKTVADQASSQGLTWRAYLEGMSQPCQRPEPGAADPTTAPAAPADPAATTPAPAPTTTTPAVTPPSPYATSLNPFAYFRSLTDPPDCKVNDLPLEVLARDLERNDGLANLTYVAAGRTAADPAIADTFLKAWVPRITRHAAFKQDGMLVVTFDEAVAAPGTAPDSASCCGQKPGPNVPAPGGATGATGGGRVGAVVLSPFVSAGRRVKTPYNHYSLSRTISERLGLEPLGFAAAKRLRGFGKDVFRTTLDPFAADALAASARAMPKRPRPARKETP